MKRQPCVYCGMGFLIPLNLLCLCWTETSGHRYAIQQLFLLTIWPVPGLLNAVLNTLGTKQDTLFHYKNNEVHWDDTGPDVNKIMIFHSYLLIRQWGFFCHSKPMTRILMTWKSNPITYQMHVVKLIQVQLDHTVKKTREDDLWLLNKLNLKQVLTTTTSLDKVL